MRRTLITLALLALSAGQLAGKECTTIFADMVFCPDEAWQEMDVPTPEGIMIWENGSFMAKAVMESHVSGTSLSAAETMEAVKKSVRDSLPDPDDVSFAEYQIVKGKGIDHGIIAYSITFNGEVIRVHHSFLLGDTLIVQFITHADAAVSDKGLSVHRDFVSLFKLIKPAKAA